MQSVIKAIGVSTLIAIIAFGLTVGLRMVFQRLALSSDQPDPNHPSETADEDVSEATKAWSTIAGSLVFVGLAFFIGMLTGISPIATLSISGQDFLWAIAATFPMLSILVGLEVINHPTVLSFRERQIEFFANLGFEFTPLRILLMSLGAGVGEELLFRGALQGWLSQQLPIFAAIIIPSIIFGLLHHANRVYMIIAGVIGAYLGGVFWLTGNIVVPIIAHTLYDIVAFVYTVKLIDEWRGRQASIEATSDSSL